MPKEKWDTQKRNRRWLWTAGFVCAALALGLLLAASGFAFAATKESHDSYCASCHTQPESTYYQRSLVKPVDLASAHTAKKTLCIDCHSGPGVPGRLQAELSGAKHALAYYTHTAVQPGSLTKPIADENCMKCHDQLLARQDLDNHFHTYLAQWQQIDPNAAGCASCHPGHLTDGSAKTMYLNEARTGAVCAACHRAIGRD